MRTSLRWQVSGAITKALGLGLLIPRVYKPLQMGHGLSSSPTLTSKFTFKPTDRYLVPAVSRPTRIMGTNELLNHRVLAVMLFKPTSVLALVFAAVNVHGICPGYKYGIADLGNTNCKSTHPPSTPRLCSSFLDFYADRIFDTSCNVVETDIYFNINVCTIGKFSCSPPPITITGAEIQGRSCVPAILRLTIV